MASKMQDGLEAASFAIDSICFEAAQREHARLLTLPAAIAVCERLEQENEQLKGKNDDLETENFALSLQNLQLEESGVDPTLLMQRDACQQKMLEACKERNEAQRQLATREAQLEKAREAQRLIEFCMTDAKRDTPCNECTQKALAALSGEPTQAARFTDEWSHSCAGVCANITLWIPRCPHCGMPAALGKPQLSGERDGAIELETDGIFPFSSPPTEQPKGE
jgi:hypothetical protein